MPELVLRGPTPMVKSVFECFGDIVEEVQRRAKMSRTFWFAYPFIGAAGTYLTGDLMVM